MMLRFDTDLKVTTITRRPRSQWRKRSRLRELLSRGFARVPLR